MKPMAPGYFILAGCLLALPAAAALKAGDQAPDFQAQAALAGKEFTFSLGEALKNGAGGRLFLSRGLYRGMQCPGP